MFGFVGVSAFVRRIIIKSNQQSINLPTVSNHSEPPLSIRFTYIYSTTSTPFRLITVPTSQNQTCLIASNPTRIMSGLEKSLFNLKVPGCGVYCGRMTRPANHLLVHSKATEPTSRQSGQRRDGREEQAQEGPLACLPATLSLSLSLSPPTSNLLINRSF